MNPEHQATSRPAPGLMLLISLLQGLALLLLWRAATNEVWPSQTPALNFPLWTLATALPLLLLLGLENRNQRRTALAIAGFCAALALLGAHIGWQAAPWGEFPVESLTAAYVLPLILGCFLGLLFLRPLVEWRSPDYGEIFADSWRNALVAALSSALAIGVTIVLMLWGELFRVIGIEFFIDLFTEDWFLFPVLSVVVGFGIHIFRGLAGVIGGIASLLQGLMWLLLPLVLTVTALFLGALPFTGLEPLWSTGSGTSLLMALNLFALFALNAVYQSGGHEPYPPPVHRLLCAGAALLPAISLLALYGLYLRVDQYGWTVARCWALLISLLITLFSLGYAGGALRFRAQWTAKLAGVNLPMSALMLGLILLVNSPLLDFRKISLASQQGRVERGEIALEDFDFYNTRENLGRPGWLWMRDLIEDNRESNPELVQLMLEPIRHHEESFDFAGGPGIGDEPLDFGQRAILRPGPFAIPETLAAAMQSSAAATIARFDPEADLYLFQADLNGDGSPEYILIGSAGGMMVEATGYLLEDSGAFSQLPLTLPRLTPEQNQSLADGLVEVIDPEFNHLRIGNVILQVTPPEAPAARSPQPF
ncbi:MAG: DUF4153 domain-containing protein [Gammaproteobacteria bacterium]|nr:DUF4153 domain-containing protein [Gammaproteobacteria bacterium]